MENTLNGRKALVTGGAGGIGAGGELVLELRRVGLVDDDQHALVAGRLDDLEDAYLAGERHRTDSGERISLDDMLRRYADDLGPADR